MHRPRRNQRQLEPQVAPLIMRQFMAENKCRVGRVQRLIRQIKRRFDKSYQHRAVRRRRNPQRDVPGNAERPLLFLKNRAQRIPFDRMAAVLQHIAIRHIAVYLPADKEHCTCDPQQAQYLPEIKNRE